MPSSNLYASIMGNRQQGSFIGNTFTNY